MLYKRLKIGIWLVVFVTLITISIFQIKQNYTLIVLWIELFCVLFVGFIYPYFNIINNRNFVKTEATILDVYQKTDNENKITYFYLTNIQYDGKDYQYRLQLNYDPKKIGDKFKIYAHKDQFKQIHSLAELQESFLQFFFLMAFLCIIILSRMNVM